MKIYSPFIIAATTLFFSCNNNTASTAEKENKAIKDTVPPPQTNTSSATIKYDNTKRYVFLTWDDGPQPPGTTNCKRVFTEEGVKATFFSVGFNQVGPLKKRLIDSIRNEYPQFLLANHSFSHGFNDKYSIFYRAASTDSAYNDFMRNEKDLNIAAKIIRLPGNNTWASKGSISGQKSDNLLVKKLDSAGYKIIGWDMEWGQMGKEKAPKESVEEMLKKVNQKFDDGTTFQQNMLVILSHDRLFEKQQYADSLKRFITALKQDKRYVFETIDHYPTVQ